MLYDFKMTNREIKSLESMIPEAYVKCLLREEMFGIATFDGIPDVKSLVGVVLVRVNRGFQEIVWVALMENYRFPDYGADLIRNRDEAAQEAGSLSGTFSDIPVSEKEVQEYFRLAGFEIIEPEDGDLFVRAVRLRENRKAHWLMRKLKPVKA